MPVAGSVKLQTKKPLRLVTGAGEKPASTSAA